MWWLKNTSPKNVFSNCQVYHLHKCTYLIFLTQPPQCSLGPKQPFRVSADLENLHQHKRGHNAATFQVGSSLLFFYISETLSCSHNMHCKCQQHVPMAILSCLPTRVSDHIKMQLMVGSCMRPEWSVLSQTRWPRHTGTHWAPRYEYIVGMLYLFSFLY